MSLAQRLAEPPSARKPQCLVADILDGLCDDDEAAFRAALDNPNFTATYLSRTLRDEGYEVAPRTLTRHRRAECCCVSR